MRVRTAMAVLLLAGFVHAAQPAAASGSHHHLHRADAQRVGVVAPEAQLAQLEHDLSVVAYVTALQVHDYLDALAAQAAADEAARQAAAAAPPPTPAPPPAPTVAVAPANNGAHSDAWWRGVSVCEQSGLNDSYFGYFSIMDGSAGGQSWDTQVAMANAIIARSGDGAWAQACQDAGYAASPGG